MKHFLQRPFEACWRAARRPLKNPGECDDRRTIVLGDLEAPVQVLRSAVRTADGAISSATNRCLRAPNIRCGDIGGAVHREPTVK